MIDDCLRSGAYRAHMQGSMQLQLNKTANPNMADDYL